MPALAETIHLLDFIFSNPSVFTHEEEISQQQWVNHWVKILTYCMQYFFHNWHTATLDIIRSNIRQMVYTQYYAVYSTNFVVFFLFEILQMQCSA